MIKINFLTSFKDYAKSAGLGGISEYDDDEKQKIIIDFMKRLLVVAIGPVGLWIYESQTIPVMMDNLKAAESKYTEMKQFNDSKQGLTDEIKKFEDTQARFSAQMDFINKITRDKVNEYKLFQHLKDSTPESVWINSLSLQNNSLTMSAESANAKDIETFIQRLSNTDFITDLVPVSQRTQADFLGSGIDTILFDVKAKLTSSTAQ